MATTMVFVRNVAKIAKTANITLAYALNVTVDMVLFLIDMEILHEIAHHAIYKIAQNVKQIIMSVQNVRIIMDSLAMVAVMNAKKAVQFATKITRYARNAVKDSDLLRMRMDSAQENARLVKLKTANHACLITNSASNACQLIIHLETKVEQILGNVEDAMLETVKHAQVILIHAPNVKKDMEEIARVNVFDVVIIVTNVTMLQRVLDAGKDTDTK